MGVYKMKRNRLRRSEEKKGEKKGRNNRIRDGSFVVVGGRNGVMKV